jgi:RNA polymerase sigma-70 factor, ECF subfamily
MAPSVDGGCKWLDDLPIGLERKEMRNKDDSRYREQIQTQGACDENRLATFNQYRGLLFSIAYRMLGSVADAEDMLQESFIRWQEASDIRSARAFLVTIISRLCINHLQSARIQREEYVGEWLPEPLLTDPRSDPLAALKIDESLSMAFLVLLERLTPVERAVFLLHEVFDYKHSEIAKVLDQSEANCRQILRRARQHVGVMGRRFFHIRDGRIQAIYVVTNPEKLSHLPGLRATLT